eukprot:1159741-Pelagomonas_calceolata.AAC.20
MYPPPVRLWSAGISPSSPVAQLVVRFSSLGLPLQSTQLDLLVPPASSSAAMQAAPWTRQDAPEDMTDSRDLKGAAVLGCGMTEGPEQACDPHLVQLPPSSIVHDEVWATSADGTPVPVSLAYDASKVRLRQQPAPCVLSVYGAYGRPDDLEWSPSSLSKTGHSASSVPYFEQSLLSFLLSSAGAFVLSQLLPFTGHTGQETESQRKKDKHVAACYIFHSPRPVALSLQSCFTWCANMQQQDHLESSVL